MKRKKILLLVVFTFIMLAFYKTVNAEDYQWIEKDGKTYYMDSNTGNVKQWWNRDENGLFYLQYDGSVVEGPQVIGGYTYYVEDHYIFSGEKIINGEYYVFSDWTGALVSGSVRLSNGNLMYIEANGRHYNDGWIDSGGYRYYQKNGYLLEGFQQVGNKTYYFEPGTGRIKQWWNRDENGLFFLQQDGSIKQGLQSMGGYTYYIENNYIYYGEKIIGGLYYIFDDWTGALKTGSVRLSNGNLIYSEVNGKRYKDGWIDSGGNRYYQKNGYLLEGFQKVGNKTYYFEPGTGRIKQWWNRDENGLFYLQYDGSVVEGPQVIGGYTYYVENNYIFSGEKIIKGEYYVFADWTGALVSGSVRLSNGNLMYIETNGRHYNDGWINSGGNTYYQRNKYLLEGFQQIGNKTYYFEPGTGRILQWWHRDENGLFYLQYDGSVKEGLQIIGGIMYYVKDNYIYSGEVEVDGEVYIFQEYNGGVVSGIYYDSNNNIRYSTITGYHPRGWVEYNNCYYYISNDGTAYRGFQSIEGRDYIFGDDGTLQGFYWYNNNLYYQNPDGSLAKGIEYIAGRYIQFNIYTGAFEKYVRQARVIDVSHHQGWIDWDMVKASNAVDAVILRIGFGDRFYDDYFVRNKSELERLGIPYSIYLFGYAENGWEALNESNFLINAIRENNVHIATNMFGVYYDLEDWEIASTGENSYGISKDAYRDIITVFVDNVERNLCIKTRVYASKNYILERFPEDVQGYATWVAQWSSVFTYGGAYEGWQYTSSAYIPGIVGEVDMSIFYY